MEKYNWIILVVASAVLLLWVLLDYIKYFRTPKVSHKLKVRIRDPRARVPSKRSEDSGYDIYGIIPEDLIVLYPGDGHKFGTGLSTEIPMGYGIFICNRGSVGTKGLVYGAHVVDSGYRGEIFIDLHNFSNRIIIVTDMDAEILGRYIVNIPDKESEEYESIHDNVHLLKADFMEEGMALFGECIFISKQKALTQIAIIRTEDWEVEVVEELSDSVRGETCLGQSNK